MNKRRETKIHYKVTETFDFNKALIALLIAYLINK